MLLLVNRGKSDERKIKEKDSRDAKIYEGLFLWSGDRNRGCWQPGIIIYLVNAVSNSWR